MSRSDEADTDTGPYFAVVGEAPGSIEDRKGRSFVGPAGQLLRSTLRRVGLPDEAGIYINAVCCFPHGTPSEESQLACRTNLQAQWGLIPSTVRYVLLVGSVPCSQVMPGVKPKKVRNLPLSAKGKVVFPVFHPSYILRQREEYKTWEGHLARFSELVHGFSTPQEHWTDLHPCIFCSKLRVEGEPYCQSGSHRKKYRNLQSWALTKPEVKLLQQMNQERLL